MLVAVFAYTSLVSSKAVSQSRYAGVEVGHSLTKGSIFCIGRDEEFRHPGQHVNVYNGYRIGQYAAFEFGGFASRSLNTSKNHREGHTNVDGLHMGFTFFLPLAKDLYAVPGMGVALVSVRARTSELFHKEKGIVPRFMFGVQYGVTDNVALRGSLAWHKTGGIYSNIVTSNQSIHCAMGLSYSFE